MIEKPINIDKSQYYYQYIIKSQSNDLLKAFEENGRQLHQLSQNISEENGNYRYKEGKWTIKQVLMHLVDTERILAYRALRIARGDKQKLSGFDENQFAENDFSEDLSIEDILSMFDIQRESSISLYKSFNQKVLDIEGNSNGIDITPRILGWFILGHQIHHSSVLQERYLSQL